MGGWGRSCEWGRGGGVGEGQGCEWGRGGGGAVSGAGVGEGL